MSYSIYYNEDYVRFNFNAYSSIMDFNRNGEKELIKYDMDDLVFEERSENTFIMIDLPVKSHVMGLGERACGVDRKRRKMVCYNTDPNTYRRDQDPLYSSIPFFYVINQQDVKGYFVDFPGRIDFDFGVEIYNRIKIGVHSEGFDLYCFTGKTPEDILRQYLSLTGSPVLIPEWATGHAISRYTYYPDSVALEVLDSYREYVPVDAMYFDIHHMDMYKLFTWDRGRFKDPEKFIEELHKRNTKIVTIVDPSVKVDQNYDVFGRLNGTYVETKNGEIYTAPMWPGKSAFPDFFNSEGKRRWGEEIREWLKYGVDGIWLDMNEPTVLQGDKTMEGDAIHRTDHGVMRHRDVRNAYPNFQAMATYEAMLEIKEKPFILTRAGYSGIQKYAAMWTGDNISSEDDLHMQISTASSLSISGVTSCGCDLGGFFNRGNPDLLAAYYRMALFFPLYRNHKDIEGNDQEIFMQPAEIREDMAESVSMRYRFLDQIYQAIYFSHKYLKPTISPLSFYYWKDEEAIHIEDQYMLGDNILYAPLLNSGQGRRVYLPEGTWVDFNSGDIHEGSCHVKVEHKYPIFIKMNSSIIYDGSVIIYGKGKFKIYRDGEFELSHTDEGKTISTERGDLKVRVFSRDEKD